MVCQQVVGLTGSCSVTHILLYMHYLRDHYYATSYSSMGIAHMHYCIKAWYLVCKQVHELLFCFPCIQRLNDPVYKFKFKLK